MVNQSKNLEMQRLLEDLPVELLGVNVLGFLTYRNLVVLERACGSKKSHQVFMEQIQHCTPVVLPENTYPTLSTLKWFAKHMCRIRLVDVKLTADNPVFNVTNLKVDNFRLLLDSDTTAESLQFLIDNNIGSKVSNIDIRGNQNRAVMEQLSVCTRNVKQLFIRYSYNCMDWLTADILSRWKLKEISVSFSEFSKPLVILLVHACTELTSIKLYSNTMDDVAVITIAQHCPKLETLLLRSSNITWASLLALSERGLPLKELDIDSIPNIPTADIARRCSHALSCIRHLNIGNLHQNNEEGTILIPYMTGLNSADLGYYCRSYIPLLTQYCHKLTNIGVAVEVFLVSDLLSLCYANPLLEEFRCYYRTGITDSALIELIHACPHLHTLRLPYDTDITNIGILTLCEHCPQLQWLDITHCKQVTETALLQLLQCCYKLTRLYVSSSSLLKETWTQLDRNTQKRVIRL